jgi:hypothetical protein
LDRACGPTQPAPARPPRPPSPSGPSDAARPGQARHRRPSLRQACRVRQAWPPHAYKGQGSSPSARASSRCLAALPRPGRLRRRLCPPRAGRCPVRHREVQPEPPEAAGRTSSMSCTPAGHPRRRRLTGTSQLLEVRASHHGQPPVCPSLNSGRCRRLPPRVSSCTSPPLSPLPIPSVTRARSRH